MILRKLKTIAILTFMSISAIPTMGQDILARQAPIDKKMKAVDSVALNRLIQAEQMETPAADLYEDWNNIYAHRATELPDTFSIDLRGFCMPTTNRVVTSNFGPRWGRQHKGIDVKVYIGDTIRAAFDGKIRLLRRAAFALDSQITVIAHSLQRVQIRFPVHIALADENLFAIIGFAESGIAANAVHDLEVRLL